MTLHRALFLFAPLAFGLGLLSSCSSAPTRAFYVLTADGPAPSGSGVGIGVGPVALAGYLDRPNLVMQENGTRIAVAESHRWAGKLEDNFARVLATNLGRQLKTGNLRTYPWETDEGLKYQISVDLTHLHGTSEGDAVLEATWRVYSLPDRKLIATRSWSGTEALSKDGYDELVAAESRLIARFAAEVGRTLNVKR